MRAVVLVVVIVAFVIAQGAGRQPAVSRPPADYPIQAVPVADVRVSGGFWGPRLETTRTVSIPHIMRQNELTGRVANFLKAARKEPGAHQGQRYNDTDIYKVIEAASWSLATHPDAALDRQVDELIAIVAAAQEPDGYLYTPRTVDSQNPPPGVGPERWAYMHTSHELYNAGHMYEAAVAHFQDHLPVAEQTRAVGHAVRATYMFAGMTDVATLFGDTAYARTLDTLFGDVTGKRMYISGGLGSVGRTEAFGDDYVLPNQKAYTETCASIGGLLWYHDQAGAFVFSFVPPGLPAGLVLFIIGLAGTVALRRRALPGA